MAAQFGFVYLISNPKMPNIFKIGFTDRAPHQRAQELSNSTSVPAPFHILCYFEAENALLIEQGLHDTWANFRVSPNREFFEVPPHMHERLVGYFRWNPSALAFSDVSLWRIEIYGGGDDVANPWEPEPEPEQPEPAEPDLKVVGGTEAEESGQCQAA